MTVKVAELMASQVVKARPHDTVGHLRTVLERNRIHAVPVVGTEEQVLGVVSSADLARELKADTPVSQLMTEKVYTVPAYDGVHVAARVMRNHHIHHVVVTHEGQVVGMLSSFDLLKLVQDHRYIPKPPPTPSSKGNRRA